MKYLYLATALALSLATSTEAKDYPLTWENAISADDGKFAIDVISATQGGLRYQMVLRGDLVRYLVQDLGVASNDMLNDAGEIVLNQGLGYRTVVTTRAEYINANGQRIILELHDHQLNVIAAPSPSDPNAALLGSYYFNSYESHR